jgi:hypothetical protein
MPNMVSAAASEHISRRFGVRPESMTMIEPASAASIASSGFMETTLSITLFPFLIPNLLVAAPESLESAPASSGHDYPFISFTSAVSMDR